MSKKAVVWIRDDFRIKNNSALSYATNNYDTVTALYIYNKENFDDVREAQKWWVSKSLINFKNNRYVTLIIFYNFTENNCTCIFFNKLYFYLLWRI